MSGQKLHQLKMRGLVLKTGVDYFLNDRELHHWRLLTQVHQFFDKREYPEYNCPKLHFVYCASVVHRDLVRLSGIVQCAHSQHE